MNGTSRTAVIEVSGVHWASSKAVTEAVLSRRPGVLAVDANPVSQTATVSYDPDRHLGRRHSPGGCGTAGTTAPGSPSPTTCVTRWPNPALPCRRGSRSTARPEGLDSGTREAGVDDFVRAGDVDPRQQGDADRHDQGHGVAGQRTAQDVMGHGGHHGGMSMDAMVADMRNRFVVAAVLSVPVLLWSPIGREVFGFTVPAPFGLRDDVFSLLLSLPVIFYSAWIFFDGAYRALKARTLDMMVLVAVGVGAGWLYSVGVTLTGLFTGTSGDVFYEAATVLTAFVLLGHWFEMRARGGANDAIRTLLELAPPTAVVLRDGQEIRGPHRGRPGR